MKIRRTICCRFTQENIKDLKELGINITKGVKLEGGDIFERIYVDDDEKYPIIIKILSNSLKLHNSCSKEIYNDQNKIYVYSKSEIENSNYCLLYAPIGGGYPQPENIDPNYFDITYDHIMCSLCGVPQTQTRSFRVNKISPRPIWGFTAWSRDVLFAQEPFYREVFEPLGIPSRPVCKVSGKQYEGIVQIKMPISDEDMDLRYCPYSICKQCGAKKYSPHLRFPYFPEPRNPVSDIFLTKESFGYDFGSDRQIIISTSLALKLLELKAIPLSNLVPCKKDLSQYLSQHKDYMMPFVKEGKVDHCDVL